MTLNQTSNNQDLLLDVSSRQVFNFDGEDEKSRCAWNDWIKFTIEQQGFVTLNREFGVMHKSTNETQRIFWTSIPNETIFGEIKKHNPFDVATEFLVESEQNVMRLFCLWENTGNHNDDVILSVFVNAILAAKERVIVFALGGEYYASERGKKVIKWLEKSCNIPPDWLSQEAIKQWKNKKMIVKTNNTFARWFRESFPVT